MSENPDRNLAMELVRVTEASAMASARLMGFGDKIAVDQNAVNAMRTVLATISMDGVVIIGEGEKDKAPMLYNGEKVGNGSSPKCDVAVDPIDGTTLASLGQGNALAAIAVTTKDKMFDPGPCVYMNKIVVGPSCVGAIDINSSIKENLSNVAKAKNTKVSNLTTVILNRDRHLDLISDVRAEGARIRLIQDGDIAGAISTAWPESGADILLGIGGTPEGVLAAAALSCMGGEIQGKLWPRDKSEKEKTEKAGYDLEKVLTQDDLIDTSNSFFAATGVTDGDLLKGVQYTPKGATTQSLVMRSKSGTVRLINASHRLDKLSTFSSIDYQ